MTYTTDAAGVCERIYIIKHIFFKYVSFAYVYVRKRLTKFMSAREFMGERGIARGPQRFRNYTSTLGDFVFGGYML